MSFLRGLWRANDSGAKLGPDFRVKIRKYKFAWKRCEMLDAACAQRLEMNEFGETKGFWILI